MGGREVLPAPIAGGRRGCRSLGVSELPDKFLFDEVRELGEIINIPKHLHILGRICCDFGNVNPINFDDSCGATENNFRFWKFLPKHVEDRAGGLGLGRCLSILIGANEKAGLGAGGGAGVEGLPCAVALLK